MFRGRITAVAASGFVGLFSLFNMIGRFFWSSTSDYIGRKSSDFVFFALGTFLYALVPYTECDREHRPLRALLRRDLQHVWRRLRNGAGLSA
jgi:MFS family permease